ncbi:MAG: hypothetical protein GY757_23275, partial [bacterium]|nr:hypothetical protein [bacterium]
MFFKTPGITPKGSGLVESVEDPMGNIDRFEYDDRGALKETEENEKEGKTLTHTVKNDFIKTQRDLNGTTITNTYDGASRLRRREIVPGEGVEGSTLETFEYDGLNRLIEATNENSKVEFRYTPAGRLHKEILSFKERLGTQDVIVATYEVVYGYDDNGNRTRITYPSGMVVDIAPDQRDRIHTVKLGDDTITEYIYEGKAKVSKKKLSNEAVVMSAGYDKGKRPESLTYKAGSNVLFEKIMSWTLANMKASEGKGPAGAAEKEKEYKYDTGNRLRKEEKFKEDMVSEASTFAVDDVDNLLKVGASDIGMTLDTDHNERHQITGADYKRTVGNTALKVHVEPEYDNNG